MEGVSWHDTNAAVWYSQAVRLGDLIFVSGQVAWDGQDRKSVV